MSQQQQYSRRRLTGRTLILSLLAAISALIAIVFAVLLFLSLFASDASIAGGPTPEASPSPVGTQPPATEGTFELPTLTPLPFTLTPRETNGETATSTSTPAPTATPTTSGLIIEVTPLGGDGGEETQVAEVPTASPTPRSAEPTSDSAIIEVTPLGGDGGEETQVAEIPAVEPTATIGIIAVTPAIAFPSPTLEVGESTPDEEATLPTTGGEETPEASETEEAVTLINNPVIGTGEAVLYGPEQALVGEPFALELTIQLQEVIEMVALAEPNGLPAGPAIVDQSVQFRELLGLVELSSALLPVRETLVAELRGPDIERFDIRAFPEEGYLAIQRNGENRWSWNLTPDDESMVGTRAFAIVISAPERVIEATEVVIFQEIITLVAEIEIVTEITEVQPEPATNAASIDAMIPDDAQETVLMQIGNWPPIAFLIVIISSVLSFLGLVANILDLWDLAKTARKKYPVLLGWLRSRQGEDQGTDAVEREEAENE